MTRDQIIEAAREAGFNPLPAVLPIVRQPDGSWVVDISDELERFTNQQEIDVRDQCAAAIRKLKDQP